MGFGFRFLKDIAIGLIWILIQVYMAVRMAVSPAYREKVERSRAKH